MNKTDLDIAMMGLSEFYAYLRDRSGRDHHRILDVWCRAGPEDRLTRARMVIKYGRGREHASEKKLKEELMYVAAASLNVDFATKNRDQYMADGWRYPVVEKAESSKSHLLLSAPVVKIGGDDDEENRMLDFNSDILGVVMLQHDWASVMGEDQIGEEPGTRMPFPSTIYETQMLGYRVVIHGREKDGRNQYDIYILGDGFWSLVYHEVEDLSYRKFILDQVHAVNIMLDADVAETEAVRAPEKLNRARIKMGKPPLLDYHVVNLAKRHRYKKGEEQASTGRHGVRLHFRRGHWMHHASGKTWRRWCLVGDPDLGWIEKEYRA